MAWVVAPALHAGTIMPSTLSEPRGHDAAPFHAWSATRVLERLGVEPDEGMPSDDVEQLRREHGDNHLHETEARAWWEVLLAQLRSLVVALLAAAGVAAFATQRWAEGIAVVAVILVNTAIGFATELRAVRSMAALRRLGAERVRVRRDGEEEEIDPSRLVRGDIVVLGCGELVPADLRLTDTDGLRVNEASLTGESVPIHKSAASVETRAALADRSSMLYRGTSIVDGVAEGVVVAVGSDTELGRIAALAERADAAATPLQQHLDRLGRRLAVLTLGVAAALVAVGLLSQRREAALMIETALALGIAAIPEGLPIVSTLALARGMYRLAQRNALINRLTAVETLGATGVIFSDKTGTLTENEMRLVRVLAPGQEVSLDDAGDSIDRLARRVLEIGVLCNGASLDENPDEDNPRGDPTEMALLAAGREAGITRPALLDDAPEVRVERFDREAMLMATFHGGGDEIEVAVKGAPAAVLEVSSRVATPDGAKDLDDAQRQHWMERATELAESGLRVLAMADKDVDDPQADPYGELRFVGLVGLHDPPREGVKQAIDRCQAAGIRVEMVTGDKPETARAIAEAAGIVGDEEDPEAVVMLGRELGRLDDGDAELRRRVVRANIFARVSPEQKLHLVRIHQDEGDVVAMTGDGVNDAAALKKADIGVAMGRRGTEAAKQVADMVLEDDALDTVVAAVEQGRVIFENIRKSVVFMLCTNVAEVLAVAVATAAGWSLPLLPLQILYLNVITDVFPALALSVGPGSGTEMEQPPRDPDEPVLGRGHWVQIGTWAAVIATCVLASLLLAERWLHLDTAQTVTVSFGTIAFGKLWFVFTLRRAESSALRNEITTNRWVWAAIALCIVLLLSAIRAPMLSELLGTADPTAKGWVLMLVMSGMPWLAGESARALRRLGPSVRALLCACRP